MGCRTAQRNQKTSPQYDKLALPSSPKGEIVGIMAQVLSLMATHTGDRSQYNRSVAEIDDHLTKNEENKKYADAPFSRCGHRLGPQALRSKGADMFAGSQNKRCGPKVHTLSCREKHTWGFLCLTLGI